MFLNVFNLILFIYLFLRTFEPFLNKMLIMFEYFAGKITNFDANGGRIFLDLGHILRDVLNRVCVSVVGNVSHPFSS